MERFTLLYTIAYAILNSMENLHFDKEGYFHVLVFYGLFYKTNRKHFFLCSHVIETPISISHSPKLPLVFLQMYGTWKRFLFLYCSVKQGSTP